MRYFGFGFGFLAALASVLILMIGAEAGRGIVIDKLSYCVKAGAPIDVCFYELRREEEQ